MEEQNETPNFRRARRKSSMSLSCCFSGNSQFDQSELLSSSASSPQLASPKMSPTWFQSSPKTRDQGKGSKNFISRMGRRRHASADFSYDPLSYARNFEDYNEPDHDADQDFSRRNFAARLPVSPPRSRMMKNVVELPIQPLEIPVPRKAAEANKNVGVSPTTTTDEGRRRVDKTTMRVEAIAEVRKNLEESTPTSPSHSTRESSINIW